jgi:hypothetical protein
MRPTGTVNQTERSVLPISVLASGSTCAARPKTMACGSDRGAAVPRWATCKNASRPGAVNQAEA